MRTFAALTGLLVYCATAVSATALTYRMEPHERACFFTNVETKGTKVAFYFAVRLPESSGKNPANGFLRYNLAAPSTSTTQLPAPATG